MEVIYVPHPILILERHVASGDGYLSLISSADKHRDDSDTNPTHSEGSVMTTEALPSLARRVGIISPRPTLVEIRERCRRIPPVLPGAVLWSTANVQASPVPARR